MTFESQYCFSNISATKTRIFMKFETYIHKISKNYLLIFRKDPCTHTRTRGINVHGRVSSRQNARGHVYASCASVCARIFVIFIMVVHYYFLNLGMKFHKDRSFCCRDICKTILMFVSSLIFNTRCKRGHTHARLRLVCARVCTDLYENFCVSFYYLMNLSLKFYKDRSFRCRDICKTILTFVTSLIFNAKMV